MRVDETINKLKSSWCCGYIEDVEIDFEELEELEKMNDKNKKLEEGLAYLLHESCKEYAENRVKLEKLETQIRKQVCDEIRNLAEDYFEFVICDKCGNTTDNDCYISSKAFCGILKQVEKGENNNEQIS